MLFVTVISPMQQYLLENSLSTRLVVCLSTNGERALNYTIVK